MTTPLYKISLISISPCFSRPPKIYYALTTIKTWIQKFKIQLTKHLLTVALIADPFLYFNNSSGYQQLASYIRLLQNFTTTKGLTSQ